LGYLSSGDSRVASTAVGNSFPQKRIPTKYPTNASPIPLADGIEARLIEAEAALQAHDATTWANILNTLRQSAGTAVIPALTADSTTTASDSMRVGVLFRERAFWLYATGHRQGDMRRLVRQYQRAEEQVYPVGVITYPTVPVPYTPDTNLPVPATESDNNPNYAGCANRDA
jgi:hypothetical protein